MIDFASDTDCTYFLRATIMFSGKDIYIIKQVFWNTTSIKINRKVNLSLYMSSMYANYEGQLKNIYISTI